MLWPLAGWVSGAFVWAENFVASDLKPMLLVCGVAGPLVLLIRPICECLTVPQAE